MPSFLVLVALVSRVEMFIVVICFLFLLLQDLSFILDYFISCSFDLMLEIASGLTVFIFLLPIEIKLVF